MKFKLENPQHQITAIQSVVEVFRGMERNTYDNAHVEDIHSNVCSLSQQELMGNIKRIITENNVPEGQSCIIDSNDACIEMETGTGKTLTYIQTAYELYRTYGLTKFIVLVPSIPIRQGVIDTFENFKEQLEDKYETQAHAFVYDSSKLMYSAISGEAMAFHASSMTSTLRFFLMRIFWRNTSMMMSVTRGNSNGSSFMESISKTMKVSSKRLLSSSSFKVLS